MVIIMLPFAGAFTVIDCSRPLLEGIAIQIGPLTCSTPSWAAASEARLHTRVMVAARTTLRIFMEIPPWGFFCSGTQAAEFGAYQCLQPFGFVSASHVLTQARPMPTSGASRDRRQASP